uniref:Fe2OG dioxygenase domain-containing protein n=1 Tax=Amorphochlora amoebiformis TaxID=1561963 RepID=A0A7S0H4Y5_9EUKA
MASSDLKEVGASLRERGYAMVDSAVNSETASCLREEIEALKAKRILYKNATHIVGRNGGVEYLEKANIFEWDSKHPRWKECSGDTPTLQSIHRDPTLLTSLTQAIRIPDLTLSSQTLKVQFNAGKGGCFPIHYDTDAGVDGRVITAILYLNSDWNPGDGGELALYPFPLPTIKVEPISGRLALFSSALMPHRVLPSNVSRHCLTLWLSRPQEESQSEARAKAKETEREAVRRVLAQGNTPSWEAMMEPEVRKLIAKGMLKQEWRASIEQAHVGGDPRQIALTAHDKNVEVIEKIFKNSLEALRGDVNGWQLSQRGLRWLQ